MKIATIISAAAIAATAMLPLTGCVTDELFNTSHPGHATIAVTADWAELSDETSEPASWSLRIGDYTAEETSGTHASRHLFEPGIHAITAWNNAEDLTVSGAVVTVVPESDARAGAIICGNPGWMAAYAGQIAAEADSEYEHSAAMKQLTRRLTLTIELTGSGAGEIESFDALMGGAASSLDFATGAYGEASSIRLSFGKEAGAAEGSAVWTAEACLLGVAGESQTLKGSLLTASGEKITFESDLSAMLAGFNSDKISPLAVRGTIRVEKTPEIPDEPDNPDNPDEPEKPVGAGVTATIGEWQKVDAGNVDAH